MPTFIDESGDTGALADAASRHFRLAAVWVPSREAVEAIRAEIRAVRDRLGLRANYEFKFSKTGTHADRRREFFRAALAHEFRFTVCSLDKATDPWGGAETAEFHWATAVSLAATLRPVYLAAHAAHLAAGRSGQLRDLVLVDDNKDDDFLVQVKKSFRDLGKALDPRLYLVGEVRFGDSKRDDLLQLADTVCGAFGAHLDGNCEWYDLIAERDLGMS